MAIDVWTKEVYDSMYRSSGERRGRYPGTRPPINLHYHWWGVGYHMRNNFRDRVAPALKLRPGAHVLMLGSGFGWSMEGLDEIGVSSLGTDLSPHCIDCRELSEEDELIACIKEAGHPDPDDYWVIGDGPDVERPPPWVLRPHPNGSGNLHWQIRPLDLYLRERWGGPLRSKAKVLPEPVDTNSARATVERNSNKRITHIITEEVVNCLDDDKAADFLGHCQRMAERSRAKVLHIVTPFLEGKVQDDRLNWKTGEDWRAFARQSGVTHAFVTPGSLVRF